MNLVKYFPL